MGGRQNSTSAHLARLLYVNDLTESTLRSRHHERFEFFSWTKLTRKKGRSGRRVAGLATWVGRKTIIRGGVGRIHKAILRSTLVRPSLRFGPEDAHLRLLGAGNVRHAPR